LRPSARSRRQPPARQTGTAEGYVAPLLPVPLSASARPDGKASRSSRTDTPGTPTAAGAVLRRRMAAGTARASLIGTRRPESAVQAALLAAESGGKGFDAHVPEGCTGVRGVRGAGGSGPGRFRTDDRRKERPCTSIRAEWDRAANADQAARFPDGHDAEPDDRARAASARHPHKPVPAKGCRAKYHRGRACRQSAPRPEAVAADHAAGTPAVPRFCSPLWFLESSGVPIGSGPLGPAGTGNAAEPQGSR
jgi:hypothetical protein